MVLGRVDLLDGVASHLETLVVQLHRAGHDVKLFTGPVSFSQGWAQREDSIRRHTAVWERGSFASGSEYRQWLRGVLARHPVDVLHLHGLRLVPSTKIAVRWRVPVVATAHPSRTSTPDPSLARRRLLRAGRFAYRALLPDRAIAVSTEMGEWFNRVMQVPQDRIRVICHGCDSDYYTRPSSRARAEARRAVGLPDDAAVAVLVGRLDAGKRHETAVRALARLAGEGRNVALLIAGPGDVQAHVDALQRSEDPDRRLLVRWVANAEDIRPVYAAGNFILHPSEREAFALVVAEAMLCGLIPLRTPTGGARDQIQNGVTGFTFATGDDASLSDHLRWLLDHPTEMATIGMTARRVAVERFGAAAMAERTGAVYRELAGNASRAV